MELNDVDVYNSMVDCLEFFKNMSDKLSDNSSDVPNAFQSTFVSPSIISRENIEL